jgi:hypothetical protein
MDFVIMLIGFVTLFIAVPPSIKAMRDLGWIGNSKSVTHSETQISSPNDNIELFNDHERVLLALKPERAKIPGTIEYELMAYEDRLPEKYRKENPLTGLNSLIRNPSLIRWMATTHATTALIYSIIFLMLGVVLTSILLFLPRSILDVFGDSMLLIAVVAFIVFFTIVRREEMKTVVIVDEYLDYLRLKHRAFNRTHSP